MALGLTYSQSVRLENRSPLANGVTPCLAPHLSTDPRSRPSSLINVGALFAGEPCLAVSTRERGWSSCSTNHRTCRMSQPGLGWNCTPIPSTAGVIVGRMATSPWSIKQAAGVSPPFPPRDRAVVKAIACEAVCQTKLPLSRLLTSDLADRTSTALGRSISPSTVWRILDTDAIKPWRYQYWIFPRDPMFSEKAGRVLDLYAGSWEGKPLGCSDYIISSDEKTSIQARIRCHATLPTGPGAPCVWNTNTSAEGPRSTWPLGMSAEVAFWAGASRKPGSTRSVGWSSRSCGLSPTGRPGVSFGSWTTAPLTAVRRHTATAEGLP